MTALLFAAGVAKAQQDVGHKVMGSLGIKAGFQNDSGVYIADKFVWYGANRLLDRHGNPVPIEGLDIDAYANVLGMAGVWKISRHGPWVGASFAVPVAWASLGTSRPEASLDRFGLADLYVQPLRIGWRLPHLDLGASYAFYVPTGRFELGGTEGVSRGQWTQELSLSSALFFDRERRLFVSALASYDLNQPKIGLDLVRGDTVQLQGGAGIRLGRRVDLGLAMYALWQVRDDRGSDLPPVLRGARDQVFGLGPDIELLVPQARLSVGLRYEHDLVAHSRPFGQVAVVSLRWGAWTAARSGQRVGLTDTATASVAEKKPVGGTGVVYGARASALAIRDRSAYSKSGFHLSAQSDRFEVVRKRKRERESSKLSKSASLPSR